MPKESWEEHPGSTMHYELRVSKVQFTLCLPVMSVCHFVFVVDIKTLKSLQ